LIFIKRQRDINITVLILPSENETEKISLEDDVEQQEPKKKNKKE
jgi:hypothetical protein